MGICVCSRCLGTVFGRLVASERRRERSVRLGGVYKDDNMHVSKLHCEHLPTDIPRPPQRLVISSMLLIFQYNSASTLTAGTCLWCALIACAEFLLKWSSVVSGHTLWTAVVEFKYSSDHAPNPFSFSVFQDHLLTNARIWRDPICPYRSLSAVNLLTYFDNCNLEPLETV